MQVYVEFFYKHFTARCSMRQIMTSRRFEHELLYKDSQRPVAGACLPFPCSTVYSLQTPSSTERTKTRGFIIRCNIQKALPPAASIACEENVVRAGFRPNMKETERNLVTKEHGIRDAARKHNEPTRRSGAGFIPQLPPRLPRFAGSYFNFLLDFDAVLLAYLINVLAVGSAAIRAREKPSLIGRWAFMQHRIISSVK